MISPFKVVIIGLDGAEPSLVFDAWHDDLPNLKNLLTSGIYGNLRSTDPPITCPAWMSMMTGKNPGKLGVYGFKNRKDYSYYNINIANAGLIKEDTLWDILGRGDKKCIILGVPQTYPPRSINGHMITCFLTPSLKSQFTYPAYLKHEILSAIGDYVIDVQNFRTHNKEDLLQQIYHMTENRFKVAHYLLQNKEWDFFMMVDMGIDRIHHAFWKFMDERHRNYRPGNPYENAIKDYYRYVDGEIGKILNIIPPGTIVIIVSDHGGKRMDGGIAINQWLMENGYLRLEEYPQKITLFKDTKVNWHETKAWGDGGYCCRLYLNVKGREPYGIIAPADYDRVRNELKAKLEGICDESGQNLGTRVLIPEEIYGTTKNIAPDLIVYFGDLAWRSIGSLGHEDWRVFENDTGPDDANHNYDGIFIMSGNRVGGPLTGLNILDVAPTVLSLFGINVPPDLEGKVII